MRVCLELFQWTHVCFLFVCLFQGWDRGIRANPGPPHCTEIDFALSFGAVIVKMIDLSKTESRDFFGIILDQENSQKLHLLPKSC